MNVQAKIQAPKQSKPHTPRSRPLIFAISFILLAGIILLAIQLYQTLQDNSLALTEDLNLPEASAPLAEITPFEWQHFTISSGDTLGTILTQAGISTSEIQSLLHIKTANKFLTNLQPGNSIRIQVNQQNELIAYSQEIDNRQRLCITKNANHLYQAIIEPIPIETRITFGRATIKDSLFVSGIRAGMDDALIMKLAEIFAYDIDFALDIRPGDSFSMLYEEKYLEGKKVGTGAIVAAEFKTQGRTYHAIRYTDASGKTDYFTPHGTGMHKAFIRTPVNYTRISSHFNLKRQHPILHRIRAHKGVDYAAPRGTPVKSVGEGKITFMGTKGGYGKTVAINHGRKQGKQYTTLYAHLSRFSPTLRVGSRVKQGQVIAYVGSTGLATAPHLHYEFHVDGIHRNPLTVALPRSDGIQGLQAPRFVDHTRKVLTLMAYHEKLAPRTKLAYNE